MISPGEVFYEVNGLFAGRRLFSFIVGERGLWSERGIEGAGKAAGT
jgi:hypothetical protein